jgi:hypothetical protein
MSKFESESERSIEIEEDEVEMWDIVTLEETG